MRNRLSVFAAIVLLFAATACGTLSAWTAPAETRGIPATQAALCEGWIADIEAGRVTDEQTVEFLKEMQRGWEALDVYFNGSAEESTP